MKIGKDFKVKILLILLFACLIECIALIHLEAALAFLGICFFSTITVWCIYVLMGDF
jgi:hypothetical protein